MEDYEFHLLNYVETLISAHSCISGFCFVGIISPKRKRCENHIMTCVDMKLTLALCAFILPLAVVGDPSWNEVQQGVTLAAAAYDKEAPPGWKIVGSHRDALTGVYSFAMQEEASDKIWVVFRGSANAQNWMYDALYFTQSFFDTKYGAVANVVSGYLGEWSLKMYDEYSQLGTIENVVGHSLGGACANVVSYFRSIKGITFESISTPTALVTNFRSRYSAVSSAVFGNYGLNTKSLELPGLARNDIAGQHSIKEMKNFITGRSSYVDAKIVSGKILHNVQTSVQVLGELASLYQVVMGLTGKSDEARIRAIITILTPPPLAPIVNLGVELVKIFLDSRAFVRRGKTTFLNRPVDTEEKYRWKVFSSSRTVKWTDKMTNIQVRADEKKFEIARKECCRKFIEIAMVNGWTTASAVQDGNKVAVSGGHFVSCPQPCAMSRWDKINMLTLAYLDAAGILLSGANLHWVGWYGTSWAASRGVLSSNATAMAFSNSSTQRRATKRIQQR